MNTRLIGVSGKKRSGKDTVSDMIIKILAEEKGITYEKHAFGDKVKQAAEVLTGIPWTEWETDEQKAMFLPPEWDSFDRYGLKAKVTRRKFMTTLGSDAITSHLHKEAWINATFRTYTPESNWIVKDVRFKNEIAAVKERGGVLIRVANPRRSDPSDNHPSEVELDKYTGWDFHILNNSTLEDLEHKVRIILLRLKLI